MSFITSGIAFPSDTIFTLNRESFGNLFGVVAVILALSLAIAVIISSGVTICMLLRRTPDDEKTENDDEGIELGMKVGEEETSLNGWTMGCDKLLPDLEATNNNLIT